MTVKRILFFASIVCITYLLVISFSRLDFLASMNNAQIMRQKIALDSLENIDSVKDEAKRHLDVIMRRNRSEGNLAFSYFLILLALLIAQFFLWPRSKQATL